MHDEKFAVFDSTVSYRVIGGKECYSNADARGVNPIGSFDSGKVLASKTFVSENEFDNQRYTMGPFFQKQGEWSETAKAYIVKIICNGLSGDDGNLYRYFISSESDRNVSIPLFNAFTFEYSFRFIRISNKFATYFPMSIKAFKVLNLGILIRIRIATFD